MGPISFVISSCASPGFGAYGWGLREPESMEQWPWSDAGDFEELDFDDENGSSSCGGSEREPWQQP